MAHMNKLWRVKGILFGLAWYSQDKLLPSFILCLKLMSSVFDSTIKEPTIYKLLLIDLFKDITQHLS